MKKFIQLLGMLACGACLTMAGPLLTLIPSGPVDALPGSTVGWGYSITNDDPVNWFMPTSVSPPAFLIGVPTLLFDYPVVAPLSTVTQVYTGSKGMLKLAVFGSAVPGQVDGGSFLLDGDFYSANPYSDPTAQFVAAAPRASANGGVNVTEPSGIPEPQTAATLAAGIALLLFLRTRR